MKKSIFFPNLDGLRFFAFFSVFLYHSGHTTSQILLNSPIYLFLKEKIYSNGFMGVNLFFVLSGFLISYLLFSEKKMVGKINIGSFYIRRSLRIWPLYFACVLFGFVFFPLLKNLFHEISQETANPFYFVTFLSNFNNIINGLPDSSVLGVLWSVAIEEQFYFFWPMLLKFIPEKRYNLLFLFIIVGSLIFRWMNMNNYMVLHFHTLSVISDMAVGAMCAWFSFKSPEFTFFFKKMKRRCIGAVYVGFGLLLIFRHSLLFGIPFYIPFDRLLLSLFFAFIILEQNYARRSILKVSRLKQITSLGKYTYGLYCLHFIGILIAIKLFDLLPVNDSLFSVMVLRMFLALFLTIGIGWLSYNFFEIHFLNLKKNFTYIKKKHV